MTSRELALTNRSGSRVADGDGFAVEMSEMPSDIVHLIGGDPIYEEEPPISGNLIPIDEDLLTRISDANG